MLHYSSHQMFWLKTVSKRNEQNWSQEIKNISTLSNAWITGRWITMLNRTHWFWLLHLDTSQIFWLIKYKYKKIYSTLVFKKFNMLMLNVVFRMYIQEDYVAGNLTIGLGSMWTLENTSDFWYFYLLLIVSRVHVPWLIWKPEIRSQVSPSITGYGDWTQVVRLAQEAPVTTEPSSQHITLVFALQVWEVVVLKVLSSLRLHYVMIREILNS